VDLTGRYPYSPAIARALLAEAGYPHGFSMTLKLPPPAYARRSGEIIASQLSAVGISARIENIEWAQWLDQVFSRHEFDATVIQHAEPMDYDIYARDGYYFGYANAGFKPLMARLEQAIDPTGRIAALAAIQRRIAEDAVNVFLFQYPKLSVYDRRVHGLELDSPMGGAGLGRASVEGNLSGFQLEMPAPVPGWLRLLPWMALSLALLITARASGWRAACRRLGILLITLLVASAVIFLMLQVMPGDPARYMLGLNANAQNVAAVRHELGLDGSAIHRYLAWIGGVVRGDLGLSYTYRVPVGQLVVDRLAVSAPLAIHALFLTLLLAFPLGIVAAWKRGSWQDPVISAATQVGVAVPNFWLGLLLILCFAVGLRWVPAGGFPGWSAGWGAALVSLTLPAIALALPQAAILARVLRASLLDAVQQDYLRTARAKGLSPFTALLRHALPNALLPVLSVLGLQLSFLLAGAVVIENVFYLPGLGRLLFQAIVQRDLMVVQSVVLLLVIAVVAVSFIVDLCQAWVDPRIRAGARA
jgi:ABC-type dipeptide/oligopeptide/nickel transport system permease component